MTVRRLSSPFNFFLPVALATVLQLVTGCALQGTAPVVGPSFPIAGAAVGGRALGGGIPIVGAQVTLWQTSSNGYPSASSACYDAISGDAVYAALCPTSTTRSAATSIVLATTTTGASGNFSFTAGSYTCDSGQYVYITATGGNTGAGTNTASVQIAPLGSCSNFQTSTQEQHIRINLGEATTVVAAYALGNFMYVTDNGTGTQVTYISAPASNNSPLGSCTSPSGAGTGTNATAGSITYTVTCASAGLAHAFANAANIVDAVHFDGTSPTGAVLSAPASNSSGLVPQALINTIANALEFCTNSANTSATPSSACSRLFTTTTPATATNGASPVAPTNELQAALNLAKDPASSAATNSTSGIFALSTPQGSSFMPNLPAAPTDYSIAIWYPGTTSGSGGSTTATPFGYPVDLAVDANDDVYVLVGDATTPTKSGVASLTFNGGSNFAATESTAYCDPGQVATDTIGDVWASNNSADTTAGDPCVAELIQYSAANGTVANSYVLTSVNSSPFGLAVDRYNDLWFSRNAAATSLPVDEASYSNGGGTGGTFTIPSVNNGAVHTNNTIPYAGSVALDPHQNVWFGTASTATTQPSYSAYVLSNLASTNVPFYGYSNNYDQTAPASALPATEGNGIAIDANGNGWAATAGNVTKLTSASSAQLQLNITKYSISSGVFTGTTSGNPFTTGQAAGFVLGGFGTSTFLNGSVVGLSNSNSATSLKGTLFPTHATVGNTTEAGTATEMPYINSLSPSNVATTASVPNSKAEFDGAGALWYGNNATSATIYYYQPSSGASVSLSPCFLAPASTTCAAAPYSALNGFAIDSTGSLWVSVNSQNGSTGGVLQLLGSAGPTVPQLSAGFPATKP